MKITKSKPTISQMREWWQYCEEHLFTCEDENCELYWAFAKFKAHDETREAFLAAHMRDNKAELL